MKKNNTLLKLALLAVCLVTCSINAIAGNIPEIAKTFNNVPLSTIELITTIASLASMLAILMTPLAIRILSHKKTMLLGLVLAGIGGLTPMILNNVYIILICRFIFGLGVGFISATFLQMVNLYFDGNTRSSMIGLQGSVGGLGSALETFLAGRLLLINWHASFLVYIIAFIAFAFFLFAVPDTKETVTAQKTALSDASQKGYRGLILHSLELFIAVGMATFFVIKVSTVITSKNIGTASDGSLAIVLVSLGSLISGALYSRIFGKLKQFSLPLFYAIIAVGFILAMYANSLVMMLIASFLIGFGYMAFQPYLQEYVSINYAHISAATTIILIFQYLGSFAAPYFGVVLNNFTTDLTAQFMIMSITFMGLTVLTFIEAKQAKAQHQNFFIPQVLDEN